MKKGIVSLFIIGFISVLGVLSSIHAVTTTNSDQVINLTTIPSEVFFDMTNLKPGDYMQKELIVQNDGEQDFEYIFNNQFLSGSRKLYDELLLRAESKTEVLFDGKLTEFSGLESRFLPTGESETLKFFIEMPYELGNEFQGLTSVFQFELSVSGEQEALSTTTNSRLPDTATNIFSLLLMGALIVSSGIGLYVYSRIKRVSS
ncbi:M73 family metallopeptidase [Oceanobacillus salinisoli]|uniref:hypothetical protein n=1 Tax=Oceanobacillus salinisoli TaxID=2678611 RepID=UPI0012E13660|nr:hypothetical protein [Oceanobacillus salinisoli]